MDPAWACRRACVCASSERYVTGVLLFYVIILLINNSILYFRLQSNDER